MGAEKKKNNDINGIKIILVIALNQCYYMATKTTTKLEVRESSKQRKLS